MIHAPRLLVVDEDEAFLDTVSTLLTVRLARVSVETSHSGPAALEQWHSTFYHTVISNMMMPQLDGLALLQEARAG